MHKSKYVMNLFFSFDIFSLYRYLHFFFFFLSFPYPSCTPMLNSYAFLFSSSSSCYTCTVNVNCGFCYDTHGAKYNNASCVSVNQTSEDYSTTGRCSSPTNINVTHSEFLYNFCPTSYSWMAILGLALYLMFFAPGNKKFHFLPINFCLLFGFI